MVSKNKDFTNKDGTEIVPSWFIRPDHLYRSAKTGVLPVRQSIHKELI
jgi:hypothetical protein